MSSSSTSVLTFDLEQLYVGRRLGHGSFSSVFSVCPKNQEFSTKVVTQALDAATDNETESSDCSDSVLSSKDLVVNHVDFGMDGLAMKLLHHKIMKNPKKAAYAIADLRNEARILASFPSQHPNIVALAGISTGLYTDPSHAFLVLERLHESLDKVILRWKESAASATGGVTSLFRKSHLTREAQASRIRQAAVGAARAIAFLHEQNIVFRDLKPANLGFDKNGNIKLFDFALAQHLEPGTTLTQHAGTLRYMSPEVARSIEYELSADVYSLGMVLWEICTLERPYEDMAGDDYLILGLLVSEEGVHPPLRHRISSRAVKALLRSCWAGKRSKRPTAKAVVEVLEGEIERTK